MSSAKLNRAGAITGVTTSCCSPHPPKRVFERLERTTVKIVRCVLRGRDRGNSVLLPDDHADIVGAKNIRSGALVIAREVSVAAESLVSRETSSIYNRGASA